MKKMTTKFNHKKDAFVPNKTQVVNFTTSDSSKYEKIYDVTKIVCTILYSNHE